jgi:hypothetical protein
MMLLLPPANGKRTANLGPIEDFAFLATAATMWTLWARGNLALISIPLVLLPAALCCFVLMGVELGVRQSGFGRCERWRLVLAWGLGLAAVFPVAFLCGACMAFALRSHPL